MSSSPVLEVRDLALAYHLPNGRLQVFSDISFDIGHGETVALVGESGCGKSSLAKTIYRLQPPENGRIVLDGVDITGLRAAAMRPHRRKMQMVFQDPYASLNPRQVVGRILGDPLDVHAIGDRAERRRKVAEALERVALPVDAADKYPHQFSGGQRQRIGLARALILEPQLLICDEPVSALDVSVQAQVLNLMARIKAEAEVAMLFISHDLAVVRHVADRVMVMYLGSIIEEGDADVIFDRPAHPYTRTLMLAAPVPDPEVERSRPRNVVLGDLPSPMDPPSGCRFHPRCPMVTDRCRVDRPARRQVAGRSVSCHRAEEVAAADLRPLPAAAQ